MKKQKSLCITYFLWLFFGWWGLHHFYLGRDRQAFAWLSTFGGIFLLGWFRDLWRIPEYVDDANEEESFIANLSYTMKLRKQPRFNIVRFLGELSVGYIYGLFLKAALPEETNKLIEVLLVCAGITIGVHLIGNIGREKGGFSLPYLNTLLAYAILYYVSGKEVSFLYCALVCTCSFHYYRDFSRTYCNNSLFKRIALFSLCVFLLISVWGCFFYFNAEITTEGDEKIKFRDSINHFFKSPVWLEFKSTLWSLYQEGQKNGWKNLYDEIIKAFDPKGEANARKILNVSENASQQEIKRVYKQLVRKWHPDKNKENKEEAEKKFMEIQEAYEILTSKKNSEPITN